MGTIPNVIEVTIMDYPPEKHSRFLDTQEIEALEKEVEPFEKVIGMLNACVYVLMAIPCLILIGLLIFA